MDHLESLVVGPIVGNKKEQFAALPVRISSDTRLSASHFRILTTIAYHDRFGRNGIGCTAGQEKLSETTSIHYTNIHRLTVDLQNWGYLKIHRSPSDRRRRVYRVIYDEGPKDVGQSTNNDEEKVGKQKEQDAEISDKCSRQYIGLSPIKKSCETRTGNGAFSLNGKTLNDVESDIASAPPDGNGDANIVANQTAVVRGRRPIDCLQNMEHKLPNVENVSIERLHGEARSEIVDRLNDVENGWLVVSQLDDETLTDLENKQINGELTDADLTSALKAIKAE